MKKIIKKIGIILRNILLVVAVFLLLSSLINWLILVHESKIYRPVGEEIEVYDGEYIHAASIGEGDYTFVILAGLGQPAPYYEFNKLATKLSEKYRVIILEEFGYGYSSITKKERTLDNYNYEIDKVLDYYGIDDNIIMMPHSLSGLTSLYYANSHKDSIKGIVCLDCTTSYQYEDMKDMGKTPKIIKYMSPLGLTRIGIRTFTKELYNAYTDDIPKEYLPMTDYIIIKKYMNETVINETNSVVTMLKQLRGVKYDSDLYVVNVLSSESVKLYEEIGGAVPWVDAHENLITNSDIQKCVVLEGPHMIYQHNIDKISNIVDDMMETIVSSDSVTKF